MFINWWKILKWNSSSWNNLFVESRSKIRQRLLNVAILLLHWKAGWLVSIKFRHSWIHPMDMASAFTIWSHNCYWNWFLRQNPKQFSYIYTNEGFSSQESQLPEQLLSSWRMQQVVGFIISSTYSVSSIEISGKWNLIFMLHTKFR